MTVLFLTIPRRIARKSSCRCSSRNDGYLRGFVARRAPRERAVRRAIAARAHLTPVTSRKLSCWTRRWGAAEHRGLGGIRSEGSRPAARLAAFGWKCSTRSVHRPHRSRTACRLDHGTPPARRPPRARPLGLTHRVHSRHAAVDALRGRRAVTDPRRGVSVGVVAPPAFPTRAGDAVHQARPPNGSTVSNTTRSFTARATSSAEAARSRRKPMIPPTSRAKASAWKASSVATLHREVAFAGTRRAREDRAWKNATSQDARSRLVLGMNAAPPFLIAAAETPPPRPALAGSQA